MDGALLNAEADAKGELMHRQNLRELTTYLSRPGLWRVQLSHILEILAVTKGARGGPPQSGEFTVRRAHPHTLSRSHRRTHALSRTHTAHAVTRRARTDAARAHACYTHARSSR